MLHRWTVLPVVAAFVPHNLTLGIHAFFIPVLRMDGISMDEEVTIRLAKVIAFAYKTIGRCAGTSNERLMTRDSIPVMDASSGLSLFPKGRRIGEGGPSSRRFSRRKRSRRRHLTNGAGGRIERKILRQAFSSRQRRRALDGLVLEAAACVLVRVVSTARLDFILVDAFAEIFAFATFHDGLTIGTVFPHDLPSPQRRFSSQLHVGMTDATSRVGIHFMQGMRGWVNAAGSH